MRSPTIKIEGGIGPWLRPSPADYERHKVIIAGLGPHVHAAIEAFRRDINLVLARGVRRLFAIAQDEYRRTLDKHGVLDFADLIERTL